MRWLPYVPAALLFAVLVATAGELSPVGDPTSPASVHVSPYYIQHADHDTGAPNLVTAVLADYRGYDTLIETTVIVTAGLACVWILGRPDDCR